jgi:hypothetical protein
MSALWVCLGEIQRIKWLTINSCQSTVEADSWNSVFLNRERWRDREKERERDKDKHIDRDID